MQIGKYVRKAGFWILDAAILAIVSPYFSGFWLYATNPTNVALLMIILSVIGIIAFALLTFYLLMRRTGVSPIHVAQVTMTNQSSQETPQAQSSVKYFDNRHALQMEQFLENAETVEMVALTYSDLTVHNINLIREPLSRGAHVTILILDPDSEYSDIHENTYHAAGNIRGQIRESLRLLCDEKRTLRQTNQEDQLIIRKFDYLSPHSITIINRNSPATAWIRVEDRPLGSISQERPSYTSYRKDDSRFFDKYSNEYNIIFSHSSEEQC